MSPLICSCVIVDESCANCLWLWDNGLYHIGGGCICVCACTSVCPSEFKSIKSGLEGGCPQRRRNLSLLSDHPKAGLFLQCACQFGQNAGELDL